MIGLTGGIASGKSTVTARLRELGAFVADADDVSRHVIDLPEVQKSLRSRFGDEVFSEDGSIDRRALARTAFATPEGTCALNAIMHPATAKLLTDTAAQAQSEGFPLVFVDAALLIESGFYELCDAVWLVTADEELRMQRIALRDGLTREEAADRIARQMPDEKKREYASTVIENNAGLAELIERVDEAYRAELLIRNISRYENSPDNDTYIKELMGAYEEEDQ